METFGQQGISFVIQIVLARLILSEQFGLVVMLTIFIAMAEAFINSGFGQKLIEKTSISHVERSWIVFPNPS